MTPSPLTALATRLVERICGWFGHDYKFIQPSHSRCIWCGHICINANYMWDFNKGPRPRTPGDGFCPEKRLKSGERR
jgi:hypothetical protein